MTYYIPVGIFLDPEFDHEAYIDSVAADDEGRSLALSDGWVS